MATIRDIELIFTEMELKGLNYYKVFDSDNKSLLTAQQNKDVTTSDAVKELKEFLNKIDGIVNIQVSSKSGDELTQGGVIRNQIFRYQVRLGSANNSGIISGPVDPAPGGTLKLALDQVEEKFNAKFEALKKEYEHKAEMDDLRQQIKQIQEGDKITELGVSYLEKLMNPGFIPGSTPVKTIPAINGPGPGAGITGIEPNRKTIRLQEAIRKIAAVDPHYVDHLELLASLAESNIMIYNKAIEQLKEYSNYK